MSETTKARGKRGMGGIRPRKSKTLGERWVITVSYIDWQGIRRRPQLTFPTRQQAVSAREFLEKQKARRGKMQGSAMTISQLSLQWLDQLQVQTGTQLRLESSVRNYIVPYLGTTRVIALDPATIDQWRKVLRDAGVKAAALKHAWGALSGMLRHAIALQVISTHPQSGLVAPRITAKPIEPFDATEMSRIFAAARGSFYYPLLQTIFAFGLRQGEAFGLQWGDLDEEKSQLTIQRQVVVENGKLIVKERAKTDAGMRTLAVSPEHMEIFRAQRELCDTDKLRDVPWMFPAKRGSMINRTYFWRAVWKPLLIEAGVKHRGNHHFRHTAATDLITAGESLPDVSGGLGHANPGDTMRMYVHNSKGVQGRAFGALAACATGGDGQQAAGRRLDSPVEVGQSVS